MEINKIYEEIKEKLINSDITLNEPMSKHTSFKIGGNADIFVKAFDVNDVIYIKKYANENNIPLFIMGNGSNLLVKDKGIRGITVSMALDKIETKEEKDDIYVNVQSGVKLALLASFLLKNKIAGFEFASGIPGTIGGAVRMNAGAYGEEFKGILESVTVIDEEAKIVEIPKSDLDLSYRHSRFTNNNEIIIEAKLKLTKGNEKEIKEKMQDLNARRKEKQPLDMPSAGSTFKRGNGFITAQIIDEVGLKGTRIGDAQVSEKHAGFVVNLGNATAKDVIDLTDYIKKTVYDKVGKTIELEVEIVGE